MKRKQNKAPAFWPSLPSVTPPQPSICLSLAVPPAAHSQEHNRPWAKQPWSSPFLNPTGTLQQAPCPLTHDFCSGLYQVKQDKAKHRDKSNKGLRCTHLLSSGGQGFLSTLTLCGTLFLHIYFSVMVKMEDHSSRLANLA